jgi:hypothetical protein
MATTSANDSRTFIAFLLWSARADRGDLDSAHCCQRNTHLGAQRFHEPYGVVAVPPLKPCPRVRSPQPRPQAASSVQLAPSVPTPCYPFSSQAHPVHVSPLSRRATGLVSGLYTTPPLEERLPCAAYPSLCGTCCRVEELLGRRAEAFEAGLPGEGEDPLGDNIGLVQLVQVPARDGRGGPTEG